MQKDARRQQNTRYRTDVPEAELNAALSDLRTQRRREKAQYQGAHPLRMLS